MTTPSGNMVKPASMEIGEKLWDFQVTAHKIAESGKRFRVTTTGISSGITVTREGFDPKHELIRILHGMGSNVQGTHPSTAETGTQESQDTP